MMPVPYPIAQKGLGTEFSQSEQPAEFARKLTNRFINLRGEAEKRPGLKRIPSPIDNGITGKFDLVTEHVKRNAEAVMLSSRISASASSRELYRYSSTAQAWEMVSGALYTYSQPDSISRKPYSVQMGDKTIIVAGDIRPAYYSGEDNSIYRLRPIVESGKAAASTNATTLTDAQITNWLAQTYVATNDLVYNVTKDAYGVVTSVGGGNINMTSITSAGAGGAGLGVASSPMASGDVYEIWDLVSNNIIRRGVGTDEYDNTAISTTGTTTNVIAVSGLDFSTTDIAIDDYVYNTTKAAVTKVTSVSANINVTAVSGQSSGDSMVFLKSAVPIASFPHVHYGRLYLIDERDARKIRVSGDGDPQDFTTFTQTLDASTISYGDKQPQGEEILTLSTFQKFLVAGGRRNVYIDQGTNPIADVSGDTSDITPVGLFSQGVASRRSLANIGSDMLFGAVDGMRQFRLSDILAVNTDNIAEAIKTELQTAIRNQGRSNDETVQVIHYPRRNWVMFKVGSVIYNFNYTANYINGELVRGGSWSKFTGRFPQCHEFVVKSNGDLICAYYDTSANATYLYEFDTGAYKDDDQDVVTEYQTAWLGGDPGIVLDGRYIKPYTENSSSTNYTITATSDIETQLLCDTALVSATGGGAIGQAIVGVTPVGGVRNANEGKYPLRWRGEQVQIAINTSAGNGADILSKFVLYVNKFGRE